MPEISNAVVTADRALLTVDSPDAATVATVPVMDVQQTNQMDPVAVPTPTACQSGFVLICLIAIGRRVAKPVTQGQQITRSAFRARPTYFRIAD